jgi:hypothetical protein
VLLGGDVRALLDDDDVQACLGEALGDDGTAGTGPQPAGDPPYPTGVAALVDGWRLLQMSPLIPPIPGHERDVSFMKNEFVFERMIEIDLDGAAGTSTGSASSRPRSALEH